MARLVAVLCFLASASVRGAPRSFTVYSSPVQLRYGEVHNRQSLLDNKQPLPLPADVVAEYASGEKLMAISGFDVDMVRVHPDGSESQVKLSDHYLHHYVLNLGTKRGMEAMFEAAANDTHLGHLISGCNSMTGAGVRLFQRRLQEDPLQAYNFVGFGSAAGGEYRHNPQAFEAPYRLMLRQPEVWSPLLHIINTNSGDEAVSPLLECPCTPQRQIDVAAGTIDGRRPDPPFRCSPEFEATGNPSCSLSTYVGGWRCCEDGMFVIDTAKECKLPACQEKPLDEVYMKFTFHYEDAQAQTRQVEPAACCEVTSDTMGNANLEYDIPACPAGTPPQECIHVAETVQPIGYFRHWQGSKLVDLVFAGPHLHFAGISLELIDHETNETLCEVHRTEDNSAGVTYGKGHEVGDEKGYLVGLRPCVWSGRNAARFRRDHKLRSRAVYNATSSHTGVMGIWLMEVSAVPEEVLI